MKSIPRRSHSRTRLDYRPNGLSIFYRRANEDVEEEMMRIRVIREGKKEDDSLRSSISSPPESSSWTTMPDSEKPKKKKMKVRHRKKSKKSKKSKSSKKKRMNPRPVVFPKKWKLKKREKVRDDIDTSSHYVLDHLKFLNCKIRDKYRIATVCGHICTKFPKTDSYESVSILSGFSKSDDSSDSPSPTPKTALSFTSSSSPILTAEAYDYQGNPIVPRRGIAPFRDEPSPKEKKKEVLLAVNEREKQRKAEKENAKSQKADSAEFMKPPVPPVAATESFTKLTETKKPKEKEKEKEIPVKRISSDTKFPNARSPATRERVRQLLKGVALRKRLMESEKNGKYDQTEMAQLLKKIIKESDERKKKEKVELKRKAEEEKKENEKKVESSTASLKTIYSQSILACESCTACIGCVAFCMSRHSGIQESKKKKNKKKKSEKSKSASESTTTLTSTAASEPSEKSSKSKKSEFF